MKKIIFASACLAGFIYSNTAFAESACEQLGVNCPPHGGGGGSNPGYNGNNGSHPGTDCPPGWVTSSWGCKHAPGSIPCGSDGSRCEKGTICTKDEKCLPLKSERVCPNRGYCPEGHMCLKDNKTCLPLTSERICSNKGYCPEGYMCLPGDTCLLLTSERVCSDKKHYCKNEYEKCFEDNTCYRPSGNGLIGGTSWIVGYNEQNTDPVLVEKAKKRLETQFKLKGIEYVEAIDFKKYQFVLGIGASTEAIYKRQGLVNGSWAEGWRVFLDNFTNGQHSAETQGLYNSLKGRAFGELDCHSNGAMVCLAALENKDVRAERVVLYGPQITAESLLMWNDLVKSGKIKSLQLYINKNDPVPAISVLFTSTSRVEALLKLALLDREILATAIRVIGPDIDVITLDKCESSIPAIECHDLVKYK